MSNAHGPPQPKPSSSSAIEVSLNDESMEALQSMAEEQGISLEELIRQILGESMERMRGQTHLPRKPPFPS